MRRCERPHFDVVGGAWAGLDLATPFTFDLVGRAHSRPNDVANFQRVAVPQPVLGFLRHLAPRSRHRVRVVASKEGHAIWCTLESLQCPLRNNPTKYLDRRGHGVLEAQSLGCSRSYQATHFILVKVSASMYGHAVSGRRHPSIWALEQQRTSWYSPGSAHLSERLHPAAWPQLSRWPEWPVR